MHQSNAFLDHLPNIMIVSGYTLDIKISMDNTYRGEWLTNSLCDNPMHSSSKDSVPDLIFLIVILNVMLVLDFFTHTMLIGDSYDAPG